MLLRVLACSSRSLRSRAPTRRRRRRSPRAPGSSSTCQRGQTIAAQNADERIEPASLTKLMTAYLVFDALKTEARSRSSRRCRSRERAWKAGGSRMFIEPRKPVTVDELLRGMIVQSGNDATIALAELVARLARRSSRR